MTLETVDKRWYIGYSWWITINAGIVLIVSFLGIFVPFINEHSYLYALTAPPTIGLAIITLLYRITLYAKHTKAFGLNFATFVISLIQISNVINLLNLSGWVHSWFVALLYIMILMSGIVGVFPLIGAALLVSLYLIVILPTLFRSNDIAQELLVTGGLYAASIISFFIWRGQYINEDSQKVMQLNSLLSSKQKESEILIHSIADGVIVINASGKISLINPSAAKLTQWPIEEALGLDARLVIKLSSEDGKELILDQDPVSCVLTKKETFSKVVSLIGRAGERRVISLVISPITLPDKPEVLGAVAVIRDVSAERKEEQQRADFISTASHEMRTPVAAIEGYLALAMNDHVTKIDDKAKEYLEKAHSSTQHLGRLFQDLLTSAKAEDGRLSSHPVVVELNSYLESMVDDFKIITGKKGLDLEFATSKFENSSGIIDTSTNSKIITPIYYALIDPDRMREVITNIFDNAVKYTDEGKITIAITGNQEVVQIKVTDTGPGIPAEDVPHLFQKFYRVDNTSTRATGGTGLGLFICKKIVELYNGTVWADSTLGKGTTFYINLPRLSSDRALQLKQKEGPTIATIIN